MIYLLYSNEGTGSMTSIEPKMVDWLLVPFLNNNSASYINLSRKTAIYLTISQCAVPMEPPFSPLVYPFARFSHPFTLCRVGGYALDGSGSDGGGSFIGNVYWKIYSNIFN